MNPGELLAVVVAIISGSIGYGIGHLHGQCAALKWRQELDKQFARIEAFAHPPSERGSQ